MTINFLLRAPFFVTIIESTSDAGSSIQYVRYK
jgi:hypothetical protein